MKLSLTHTLFTSGWTLNTYRYTRYLIFIFVSRINLKFRHRGSKIHMWRFFFYSRRAKKREFHFRIWQRTNEWSEENVANDSADKKEMEPPARGSIKLHLFARISLRVILLIGACSVFLVEVHFWKCCVKKGEDWSDGGIKCPRFVQYISRARGDILWPLKWIASSVYGIATPPLQTRC